MDDPRGTLLRSQTCKITTPPHSSNSNKTRLASDSPAPGPLGYYPTKTPLTQRRSVVIDQFEGSRNPTDLNPLQQKYLYGSTPKDDFSHSTTPTGKVKPTSGTTTATTIRSPNLTRANPFRPKNGYVSGGLSYITSRKVLQAMIEFKQARLLLKYKFHDESNLLDVGIKQEQIEKKVDKLGDRFEVLDKRLNRILNLLEAKAAEQTGNNRYDPEGGVTRPRITTFDSRVFHFW